MAFAAGTTAPGTYDDSCFIAAQVQPSTQERPLITHPLSSTDRQRSPVGLSLNLSSNNPYNRFGGGGASPSPRNSPFNNPWANEVPKPRPTSTNPFLDSSEMSASAPTNNRAAGDIISSRRANNHNSDFDDIFVCSPELPIASALHIPCFIRPLVSPILANSTPLLWRAQYETLAGDAQYLLITYKSVDMERFHQFSQMFANFPTLQNELSLLDKPITNGMLK